jgi:hypothetical protein
MSKQFVAIVMTEYAFPASAHVFATREEALAFVRMLMAARGQQEFAIGEEGNVTQIYTQEESHNSYLIIREA